MGDRLSKLLNDLLDLSKLESGATEYDMKANDIQSIVNSVLNEGGVLAENKSIAIDRHQQQDLDMNAIWG